MGGFLEAFAAKDRIIVAVDTTDIVEAHELVDELAGHVGAFKFGLEFGAALLCTLLTDRHDVSQLALSTARRMFQRIGGRVMWDWKFKDIPNTMAGAARGIAPLRPALFTVHASAGMVGMGEAVRNAGASKVLAVTVLTSMSADDCDTSYGDPNIRMTIRRFVNMARVAKVHGIVCAPSDLADIRQRFPDWEPEFVCPGVRPEWAATGDQSAARVMTPGEAVKAGVSRMVIGRPITQPPAKFASRREAADAIAEEIAAALA